MNGAQWWIRMRTRRASAQIFRSKPTNQQVTGLRSGRPRYRDKSQVTSPNSQVSVHNFNLGKRVIAAQRIIESLTNKSWPNSGPTLCDEETSA